MRTWTRAWTGLAERIRNAASCYLLCGTVLSTLGNRLPMHVPSESFPRGRRTPRKRRRNRQLQRSPSSDLFYGHAGDLQVWIFAVPGIADVFEGQAEGFALSRPERRDTEIDGVWVGSGSLQNAHRDVFGLCDLSQRVFESETNDGMRHGLSACVGDSSV